MGNSQNKLGTQLLVQFGNITFAHDDAAPQYFKDLPSLCIHQIAFWDEMHKEQIVGMVGNHSYHFPCDGDGKYGAQGTIPDAITTCLHMKYPEQGCLCLGIAPVLHINGTEEGQHCDPFNYTTKHIVTIVVYKKLQEDEIHHIKKT